MKSEPFHSVALAIAMACTIPGASIAGEGMDCEKLEYARLKDSSKKELTEEYCNSTAKAQLNDDLAGIKRAQRTAQAEIGGGRLPDRTSLAISELDASGRSCSIEADEALRMLNKKFKSGTPKCPH